MSNLIHHEEELMSSTDNVPNFTNPLASNIEDGDETFTFKEAIIKPYGMDFVEATTK